MSDVTDYKDLFTRYTDASADFVASIPGDVIEESDGALEALANMIQISIEALRLKVREL